MRVRALAAIPLMLAGAVAFWPGPAHADPTLAGWTSQADANPFDFVIDNSAGLGGFHPLVQADLPEDSSDFETGPFGDALAAVFWPGSAAGNAGSLVGEAGLPSQLAPLLSSLNDPVRAQSFYPQGPASATYPAGAPGGVAEMSSHADANGSWAKAALSDVSIPGVFEIKGVQGNTTATASSHATSTASGTFSSLSFLGGLVQIGSSVSTASADSDGVSPTGSSTTHIGAITVAGYPATVGSDGLVLGPIQAPLLGQALVPPLAVVNQLISIFNLKITALPQTENHQAPAEQVTSGGLQVSFAIPTSSNLAIDCTFLPPQLAQLGTVCHIPDLLQGATFTATVARVTASAVAAPPFNDVVAPSGSNDLFSIPGATINGASEGQSAPVTSGAIGSAASAPTVASAPSSAVAPSPGAAPLDFVSLSTPVKTGLIAWLLVVALIIGAGLRRLGLFLEQTPPSACPLDEDQ